jgi:hypothetical protein
LFGIELSRPDEFETPVRLEGFLTNYLMDRYNDKLTKEWGKVKFSVIIPTVGRSSLVKLVEEIKRDSALSKVDVGIYVAKNGTLPKELDADLLNILNYGSSPIGVGAAVNMALNEVPEGLVWTIADDENWLVGKIASDVEKFFSLEMNSILLPRSLFIDEIGTVVRPKVLLSDGEAILDYLYTHIHFGRNPRYASLSGACALKSTWGQVKFPEDMKIREDIDYLYFQELRGCKIVQSDQVTVQINVKLARGALREQNALEALEWARTRLSNKQRVGFLGCGWVKPLAYAGNIKAMSHMYRNLKFKGNLLNYSDLWLVKSLLLYWIFIGILFKLKSRNQQRTVH